MLSKLQLKFYHPLYIRKFCTAFRASDRWCREYNPAQLVRFLPSLVTLLSRAIRPTPNLVFLTRVTAIHLTYCAVLNQTYCSHGL